MSARPPRPDLAGVAELVEVMDVLRSPGGCPWDAEQTHASLAPYAVEEAFELAEAIETGDRDHVREELGDLLLQVVFHARVAQEAGAEGFDLDDIARGIAAKLRRRHPHVFADGDARTAAQVEARWEELKAAEKPDRTSVFDGIPRGMAGLERAAKVVARLERAGRLDIAHQAAAGEDVGAQALALVLAARAAGVDPATALRGTLARIETSGL
ncbi:MAG: MazG family protein [Austwickia sp.]|nr:MazG family protein [Actinomycetota bacterium]MCO5310078.1 MazG family protein [Austwickia sp.]